MCDIIKDCGVIIYISIIQTLPPCCMKRYTAVSEMFYSCLCISQESRAAEVNDIFVILFMPSICLLFIWGNFTHFDFLCSLLYCIAIHLPVLSLGLRSAVYCTDSVPVTKRAFAVSKAKNLKDPYNICTGLLTLLSKSFVSTA